LPQPRLPVSLRWLFPRASFVGCADIFVNDVTNDSRQCLPGITFAALPGTHRDGASFASEAIRFGASALLVEHPLPDVSVPQCVVRNVRQAYSVLCETLHGCPSQKLSLVGITGTNGKTTTAWIVNSILKFAGRKSGLLGTIEYNDGVYAEPAPLTTPDARTMSQWLSRMVDNGANSAVAELSSHALHQHRVAGAKLQMAVVTNLTQDHFDYHGNFDAYRESKFRIFEQLLPNGVALLNADDANVRKMADRVGEQNNILTYGIENDADFTATVLQESLTGSRFEVNLRGEQVVVQTSLVGRHNVANCLTAAAVANQLGLSADEISQGIASLSNVPGRLERVDAGQSFHVFVDYAHTDDALRHCVQFLRKMTTRRVICVFGAGGDRDKAKRPLMGNAASEADIAIVTSDNPRTESPQTIIDDILAGVCESTTVLVEEDRQSAIQQAVANAESDDVVLIAGKGHETYQQIGTERLPFSDRDVARVAINGTVQHINRAERLSA
jgi:UDP-N-acetylmuramoyl-L-alanyl-D-glutamate--2,6-diaminopimelate ligase